MAQSGHRDAGKIGSKARDMTKDQLLAFYTKLDEPARALFLIELAHNLTVVARGAYFQGSVTDPAKVIKANEFQHRLTRISADVLQGKTHRSPEQVTERITMGFIELDAAHFVERVVDRWSQDSK